MNARLLLVLLAGALAVLSVACNGGDTVIHTGNAPVTGISATGTGEAIGEPDVLVITVGVSAQRGSIAEAREAAAAAQAGVLDALKRNGVAEKDIQTVQFNVNPQYDFRSQSREIIGYEVSNVVTAKVRDLGKASAAIDAATEAGGNDAVVQGIQFGIDDPTALQRVARELAVKEAREQAQQLAADAGVKLGKLLSISENTVGYPVDRGIIAPATGSDLQSPSPIQPGQLRVAITVTVLYAVD